MSPSLTETFGNIVLEAMASKLPIVSFDYAAAQEHIEHRKNGLKAPYRDDETFIKLVVELSTNPNLRQSLGDQAFLSIQKNSWHKVSMTLLNIIGN